MASVKFLALYHENVMVTPFNSHIAIEPAVIDPVIGKENLIPFAHFDICDMAVLVSIAF